MVKFHQCSYLPSCCRAIDAINAKASVLLTRLLVGYVMLVKQDTAELYPIIPDSATQGLTSKYIGVNPKKHLFNYDSRSAPHSNPLLKPPSFHLMPALLPSLFVSPTSTCASSTRLVSLSHRLLYYFAFYLLCCASIGPAVPSRG